MEKQLKELAAMVLIGDGVVGFLSPRRHSLLWRFGPRPYRELMEAFAERPRLTRLLCVAEVGLGVWWALRQTPNEMPNGEGER